MTALGTRSLTLSVGGTDYTAEITDCRITTAAADNDTLTFAEAGEGGARAYRLEGVIIQDPAAASLWDKVWSAAGTTVAVVIKPAGGGTTPSASQPHFTGNVVIEEADGDLLGGQANSSATARFTMNISWPFTAKPTRLVA